MLTVERLREALSYDPATGVFVWLIGHRRPKGAIAGAAHNQGYRRIRIDQQEYLAHRLAWLHVHGEWPSLDIDHVNGVRSDNRIANLRLATAAQNQANRRTSMTHGMKGITRQHGKYLARIHKDGKSHHIGTFATAAEAWSAYQRKAAEFFGEFARAA